MADISYGRYVDTVQGRLQESTLLTNMKAKDLAEPNIDADFDLLSLSQDLLVSQPAANEETTTKRPPRNRKKDRRKAPLIQASFYDKYKATGQPLGQGAHSVVFLAKNKKTDEAVAVKSIEKRDGYNRHRILTEIDLLYHCKNHSNILQLLEFFEEKEHFFLVFEHMKGGPLFDHIERKEVFTEKEASSVTQNICKALSFLHHRGIAHRDLKPQNILCQNQDEITPVKICDFDLASQCVSVVSPVATPVLYTPVGSVEFMAPEVVHAFNEDECHHDCDDEDVPTYDKRCDLWSLGVIVYIMLCGRPPFEVDCGMNCPWKSGGSCRDCQRLLWHRILDGAFGFPSDKWSHISEEAKDLISRLLVRDAKKRLTADEVLAHPWITNANETVLQTPKILSNSDASILMTSSSKVMTYGRFVAEKQQDSKDRTIMSTPPSFGLSPPGSSSLAKRRAQTSSRRIVPPMQPTLEARSPEQQMTND